MQLELVAAARAAIAKRKNFMVIRSTTVSLTSSVSYSPRDTGKVRNKEERKAETCLTLRRMRV